MESEPLAVLLVEGDGALRESYRALLTEEGCVVRVASNGAEVLRELLAPHPPGRRGAEEDVGPPGISAPGSPLLLVALRGSYTVVVLRRRRSW